jgi:transposase
VLWERSVVEQRYDAVREVLEGRGVTEVAARSGVSRQSVYTWVGRYQAGGLAGLQDRTHRPNNSPDNTSAEVEAAVCELRRTHPGWGRSGLAGSWNASGWGRGVAGDDLADPGPQRAGQSPASPSPP